MTGCQNERIWVRFRRAIYADETIRLEWLVTKGRILITEQL